MIDKKISPPKITFFRAFTLGFACILCTIAVWLLAADILRQPPIEFPPTNAQAASLAYGNRGAAAKAARVGVARGDLWAQAAFSYGAALSSQIDDAYLEQARLVTERAIEFSPNRSDLWLLLAAIRLRIDRTGESASSALKMSYYTGPSSVALVGERLMLALQGQIPTDDEIRELVRHDIRIVLMRKPDLIPALSAAYKSASSSGRELVEMAVAEYDPNRLSTIRSEPQR